MAARSAGQKLIIDLDAVCDFVFSDDGRQTDTVIEEKTDSNNTVTKTITESKLTKRDNHEAVRFEIVKRMFDSCAGIGIDENGTPVFEDMDEIACYNTLFQYGFYKTIK